MNAIIGPKKLDEAVEEASKAFWEAVHQQFPEFSPDLLDHGTIIGLQWQMKDAVTRWVTANLAQKEDQ